MKKNNMETNRSSRHPKITGDFAESLVLYWLSKHNFECANVDHTGIDIIAKNPKTKELMGISVKSRDRIEGTEKTSLTIKIDHLNKVKIACNAFNCIPYFAFVIDKSKNHKIYCFILSMQELLKIFPKNRKTLNWKMDEKNLLNYYKNPRIKIFGFDYKTYSWWKNK